MHRVKLRFLLLSLAVLVLDQWSKAWVEAELPLHSPEPVIPGLLNLTHVQNTGVAFGLFAARGRVAVTAALAAVGLLALVVVGMYFLRTPDRERLTLAGLALILGGAVGNLIDRISTGAVTDFIDFYYGTYHWHTFNVADTAITTGIGLMAIEVFRSREGEGENGSESESGLDENPLQSPATRTGS